jgi:hypothetical protein
VIVASPVRVDEPIRLPYPEPMNVAIVVLIVVVGVVALVAAILLVTRTVLRRVTLSSGRMIAENFAEKDIQGWTADPRQRRPRPHLARAVVSSDRFDATTRNTLGVNRVRGHRSIACR